MTDIFKALKDVKRRGIEAMLENVGMSENVVDEDFDVHKTQFNQMVSDLNDLGMGLTEFLPRCRAMFEILATVGDTFDSYYNGTFNRTWPESPNHLSLHQTAQDLKSLWAIQNDVCRRSVAQVWLDQALTPTRAMLENSMPDVNAKVVARENLSRDYAHYRRKVVQIQEARRHIAPAEERRLAKNTAELHEYAQKLERAGSQFDQMNIDCKQEIFRAKIARDELLELLLINVVACQAELFSTTSRVLEAACLSLNQDKVNRVRNRIRQIVSTGGPEKLTTEMSNLNKAVLIASGKALPSDFKDKKNDDNTTSSSSSTTTSSSSSSSSSSSTSSTSTSFSSLTRDSNPPPSSTSSYKPSSIPSPSVLTSSTLYSSKSAPLPPAGNTSYSSNSMMRNVSSSSMSQAKGVPVPMMSEQSSSSSSRSPVSSSSSRSPVSPVSSLSPPVSSNKLTAVALYDNVPDEADELAFRAGDVILVFHQDDSGWWSGQVVGKDQTGLFPANYVKMKASGGNSSGLTSI